MLARRLERLPSHELPGGLRVIEASTWLARLLGLARLDELPSDHALLLVPCASVHTFGMRFSIDVAFLDYGGCAIAVEPEVEPGQVVGALGAHSVLETNAGHAGRFLAAGVGAVAAAGLSRPRRRAVAARR